MLFYSEKLSSHQSKVEIKPNKIILAQKPISSDPFD